MRLHRTKATKLAKTGEEDEVNEVLMAVGGKEVELQVWNLAKPQESSTFEFKTLYFLSATVSCLIIIATFFLGLQSKNLIL